MTKKDYELIAGVIKDFKVDGDESIRYDMAVEFAVVLQEESARFDSHKFIAACGIKD